MIGESASCRFRNSTLKGKNTSAFSRQDPFSLHLCVRSTKKGNWRLLGGLFPCDICHTSHDTHTSFGVFLTSETTATTIMMACQDFGSRKCSSIR